MGDLLVDFNNHSIVLKARNSCGVRNILKPNPFKDICMIFVAICCLFSHIRFSRIKLMSVIVQRYIGTDSKVCRTMASARLNFSLGFDEFVTRRVVF